MTNWLRRQEAVDQFSLYLSWIAKGSLPGNAGEWQELVQEIVHEAGPAEILPDATESLSATGIAVSIGGNQQLRQHTTWPQIIHQDSMEYEQV